MNIIFTNSSLLFFCFFFFCEIARHRCNPMQDLLSVESAYSAPRRGDCRLFGEGLVLKRLVLVFHPVSHPGLNLVQCSLQACCWCSCQCPAGASLPVLAGCECAHQQRWQQPLPLELQSAGCEGDARARPPPPPEPAPNPRFKRAKKPWATSGC